ncbi:MAG: biotin/lipoyl-binding protein [Lachnospiraceae bacterium]|nr:biotin/lipoyl-binding protein [Lachnospiraceae bacterium]
MNKKKLLRTILILAVIAAAVVFVCYRLYKKNTTKVISVYPVSMMAMPDYEESAGYSASVSRGRIQNVVLKESLVSAVNVSAGDTVKEGDVLLTYDQTSLALSIDSDRTRIALLENRIDKSNRQIEHYNSLIPSEYMPEGYEETIDHGPIKLVKTLTASDCKADNETFLCAADAVIRTDYLKALRSKGFSATLELYDEETCFGTYTINGKEIPEDIEEYIPYDPSSVPAAANFTARTEFSAFKQYVLLDNGEEDPTIVPTEEPTVTPEPTEEPTITPEPTAEPTDTPAPTEEPTITPEPTAEPTDTPVPTEQPTVTPEPTAKPTDTPVPTVTPVPGTDLYIKVKTDPLKEDWDLSKIVSFNGEGADVASGSSPAYYGRFSSCIPYMYERYETIYHFPDYDPSSENYMYTSAQLAQMVRDTQAEVDRLKIDLESARLTLSQDLLISENGEVLAAISGTVTEAHDPAETAAGETIITVKGTENYMITVYVNELDLGKISVDDMLTGMAYESGAGFTATVTEKGTSPATDFAGWSDSNPNTSTYPVSAVVNEADIEMRIGEMCEVHPAADDSGVSSTFFIPNSYVRSDERGSYIYKDSNGSLKKEYILTGRSLWNSYTEIKSGLTQDEYIAFPYGTGVTDGAATEISEEMIY